MRRYRLANREVRREVEVHRPSVCRWLDVERFTVAHGSLPMSWSLPATGGRLLLLRLDLASIALTFEEADVHIPTFGQGLRSYPTTILNTGIKGRGHG